MKIKKVVVHPGEGKKGRSSEGVNWCSREKGRLQCWEGKGEPLPLLADKS